MIAIGQSKWKCAASSSRTYSTVAEEAGAEAERLADGVEDDEAGDDREARRAGSAGSVMTGPRLVGVLVDVVVLRLAQEGEHVDAQHVHRRDRQRDQRAG